MNGAFGRASALNHARGHRKKTKGMLDEGVEEERRERGDINHTGSGSGLRPAALVPRESSISTHTHTHAPPAAAHLLDCWHRQPPAHAHLLIFTESHTKEGQRAQVTVIFSFFLCPCDREIVQPAVHRCCDSCDPQTPHPQGFDPSAAKMLNVTFYGLPRSNSIYSLWMFDAFEMVSDRMHNEI